VLVGLVALCLVGPALGGGGGAAAAAALVDDCQDYPIYAHEGQGWQGQRTRHAPRDGPLYDRARAANANEWRYGTLEVCPRCRVAHTGPCPR
jgi:hypothetical protein